MRFWRKNFVSIVFLDQRVNPISKWWVLRSIDERSPIIPYSSWTFTEHSGTFLIVRRSSNFLILNDRSRAIRAFSANDQERPWMFCEHPGTIRNYRWTFIFTVNVPERSKCVVKPIDDKNLNVTSNPTKPKYNQQPKNKRTIPTFNMSHSERSWTFRNIHRKNEHSWTFADHSWSFLDVHRTFMDVRDLVWFIVFSINFTPNFNPLRF